MTGTLAVRGAWLRGMLAWLILPMSVGAHAQVSSVPAEGLGDRTPRTFALTNARAVVKPGHVIDEATLLVREGRIASVGRRLAIPAGVIAIDLEGRSVFAGFIDANSGYAQTPEVVDTQGTGPRSPAAVQMQSGSRHWNRRIRPRTISLRR